jgi:hypothetical protein
MLEEVVNLIIAHMDTFRQEVEQRRGIQPEDQHVKPAFKGDSLENTKCAKRKGLLIQGKGREWV